MDLKSLFRIQSNTLHPKRGNLLLSEPTMNDFYFGRSVILIVDHNDKEGTLGVVFNKLLNVRLNEIVDVFPDMDAPIFLGGPVAENQLFFVHTLGELIPDSFKVMEGLYWGGDTDTLNTLISTGVANNKNVRFFLGYAGWDEGQLSNELSRNSWIVSPTNAHAILTTPAETMWKHYVDRMGGRYQLWLNYPQNPEEN